MDQTFHHQFDAVLMHLILVADELVKSVLNESVEMFKVAIEFNNVADFEFKFDIDLLLLFIEFNNDVDVEFKFDIDKIMLIMNYLNLNG
jgi:hypothetical protein